MEPEGTVELKPTSRGDFAALRGLFDDPSFAGWGSAAGQMDDAEIRAKYLGERLPQVECFLVLSSSLPVGLAQLHEDTARGGGMDLILLPTARGRGVGSASVHTLVERARTVHQWAYLTVDPDLTNPDGIRFWHAVGFAPVHRCPGTPERAPYLLMRRPLDLEAG